MTAAVTSTTVSNDTPDAGHVQQSHNEDEEYLEQLVSSIGEDDELTDAELDSLKREINAELSELECEFRQAKEFLFHERVKQVEDKLAQARHCTASEFLDVVALMEESYKVRREVC